MNEGKSTAEATILPSSSSAGRVYRQRASYFIFFKCQKSEYCIRYQVAVLALKGRTEKDLRRKPGLPLLPAQGPARKPAVRCPLPAAPLQPGPATSWASSGSGSHSSSLPGLFSDSFSQLFFSSSFFSYFFFDSPLLTEHSFTLKVVFIALSLRLVNAINYKFV
jgi:hypothetical protein